MTLQVKSSGGFVTVTASGHLDEVQELSKGGTKMGSANDGGSACMAIRASERQWH